MNDVAVFGAGASAMKLPQFDSTVILMVPLSWLYVPVPSTHSTVLLFSLVPMSTSHVLWSASPFMTVLTVLLLYPIPVATTVAI